MSGENRPWSEENYKIPTSGILRVPISKIYDTIIDNFTEIGILLPAEVDNYRRYLDDLDPQRLIMILIESHIQREDDRLRRSKWMMN